MTEKKLWTIDESIRKNGGPLPMSKAGVYKACADGNIPAVNVGRRIFIPNWWLDKLLNDAK